MSFVSPLGRCSLAALLTCLFCETAQTQMKSIIDYRGADQRNEQPAKPDRRPVIETTGDRSDPEDPEAITHFYDFTLRVPLWKTVNNGGAGQDLTYLYGGMHLTNPNGSPAFVGQIGHRNQRFMAATAGSAEANQLYRKPGHFAAVLLFLKHDFLFGADQQQVTFDPQSQLTLEGIESKIPNGGVRFVVKDGDRFFFTQKKQSEPDTFRIRPLEETWLEWNPEEDPADFLLGDDEGQEAQPAFEDIQGVGIAVDLSNERFVYRFEFTGFEAIATAQPQKSE